MKTTTLARTVLGTGAALLLAACSSSTSDTGGTATSSVTTADAAVTTTAPATTSGASTTARSSSSSSGSSATTSASAGGSTTTTADLETILTEARNGDVSSFVTALRASGLASELRSKQVTIFAPNDTAFAALGKDTVTSLLADPSRIKTVLQGHVVEGAWPASKLATVTSLTTMSGTTLAVTSSGGTITVGGAKVVRVDDGDRPVVVHVIDRVLGDR